MSTTTEQPAGPREQWTPGAGQAKLRALWGDDRVPVLTDEDRRRGDEIRDQARAMIEGHAV